MAGAARTSESGQPHGGQVPAPESLHRSAGGTATGTVDGAASADATGGQVAVTFVVPCYNVEDTVEQALGSLLAQTFEGIQVVAVDDASTDGTGALLARFAAGDGRVEVVTHVENAGYGASMNDGIAAARGDWLGILEPDDWVLPDMAEVLIGAVRALPDGEADKVDLVKAPYVRVVEEGGKQRFAQCAYRRRVKPEGAVFRLGGWDNVQLIRQHPSIWSGLYRRAFLEDRGIAFPEHPGSGWADNEFFYRTLLQARILYVDQPFYCYREDTPEQAAVFARAHPTLALQRWLDLDDIVRDLGICDYAVLSSHTMRAFDHLQGIVDAGVADVPEAAALRAQVFARLDPGLVACEEAITPALKRLYADETGAYIDNAAAQRLFARYRRREFAYMVRTNGPAFAMRHLKAYLAR